MCSTDPKICSPNISAWSLSRTAAPLGLFYLTEVLVGLTDLAVVGALGPQPLAAVGLAKTVVLAFLTIGGGVLSAALIFMAEDLAPERRSALVRASILIALGFAALGFTVHWTTLALLPPAGYAPDLVAHYRAYGDVMVWAIAPALGLAICKNVLNAVGRTGIIAFVAAFIVLGNLGLSIVLTHGVAGFDGMGVTGTGLATVLVNLAAFAFLAVHCVRKGIVSLVVPRDWLRRLASDIRRVVGLGWASGAQQGLESVLFVVVLFFLGVFSEIWLIAGSVVFAVMEINYVVSTALGEAVSARIARFAHDHDPEGLKRAVRAALTLCSAITASFAILVFLFRVPIVMIFLPDGAEGTAAFVAGVLAWTTAIFLFDALQVLFVHMLRGLKSTVLPMAVSSCSYWLIGVGGGLLLAYGRTLEGLGIWIGFCAGLIAAALILGLMFRSAFIATRSNIGRRA